MAKINCGRLIWDRLVAAMLHVVTSILAILAGAALYKDPPVTRTAQV